MRVATSVFIALATACSAADVLPSGGEDAGKGVRAPDPSSNVDRALASDGGASPDAAAADAGVVADPASADGITYRALGSHPGCSTQGLTYAPAAIGAYRCAAKAYLPATEDVTKPIVLLVHGNSSTPLDFERHAGGAPMLAELLTTAGHRAYAVDFRKDLVDDPIGSAEPENAARNFDHGWATPILEHFVESVLTAFPAREVSIVGFSFGVTATRDALRRLHRAGRRPFERLRHVVFAAGMNHGVSTYSRLCMQNPTMRGRAACECGDRAAYAPTAFLNPLNGPGGAFETPCADGASAFGQTDACGGHRVAYTTLVMSDLRVGTYQDEFVFETSAALRGARNVALPLTAQDESGYFYNGIFRNHYGATRSTVATSEIMGALGTPGS